MSRRTDGAWKTFHVRCAGFILLVADGIEDKGDQFQRGQHIGQSMVSMSEVDEMDSPNSGGYRMHYRAAKGRDGAHLRGPLPDRSRASPEAHMGA